MYQPDVKDLIDMTAGEIWNDLPEDLRLSLSVAITGDVPHLGNDELRHLARHLLLNAPLDPAVVEILGEHLDDWIIQQYELQIEAKSLLKTLAEHDWVDLENDTFPEWRTRPWAQILMMPWSERLPEAIVDAQGHLLNT